MRHPLLLVAFLAALASCTKDPSPQTGRTNKIIVSTNAVSIITTTSARSGGVVSSGGADSITSRGVCWSTTNNPTISNPKTTDGSGEGSFISTMTGLTSNRQYYVRAYAISAAGIYYGPLRAFMTL